MDRPHSTRLGKALGSGDLPAGRQESRDLSTPLCRVFPALVEWDRDDVEEYVLKGYMGAYPQYRILDTGVLSVFTTHSMNSITKYNVYYFFFSSSS